MKWLFNAGNDLVMSFLFGCDGGLRQSFFGTNFLWLGWETKAIFFFRDEDIYKRVLCRTNGFLSTHFPFFLLDLGFFFYRISIVCATEFVFVSLCFNLFVWRCMHWHVEFDGVSWRGRPANGKYGVATEPWSTRSCFLRKIKVGIPWDVKIGDPSQSEG